MDRQIIKEKLIEVLAGIQNDSGYPPLPITGATCPLDDLEGFDSLIWPISIRRLVKALGAEIPRRKNIFISNGRRLTVDEIVEVVHQIVNKRGGRK